MREIDTSAPGYEVMGTDPETYRAFPVDIALAFAIHEAARGRGDLTLSYVGFNNGESEPRKKITVYYPENSHSDGEPFLTWLKSLQPDTKVTVHVGLTERPAGTNNPITDLYEEAKAKLDSNKG